MVGETLPQVQSPNNFTAYRSVTPILHFAASPACCRHQPGLLRTSSCDATDKRVRSPLHRPLQPARDGREVQDRGRYRLYLDRITYVFRANSVGSISDDGLQTRLPVAILKRLKLRKTATSAYHPNSNGGSKHASHTMTQMLPMVVNER